MFFRKMKEMVAVFCGNGEATKRIKKIEADEEHKYQQMAEFPMELPWCARCGKYTPITLEKKISRDGSRVAYRAHCPQCLAHTRWYKTELAALLTWEGGHLLTWDEDPARSASEGGVPGTYPQDTADRSEKQERSEI